MYKVEMEVLLNVSCRGVQAIVKSKEAGLWEGEILKGKKRDSTYSAVSHPRAEQFLVVE
jgi:hypothetical protein